MFQKPTKPYKIKVESSSFCIFDLKTPVINRSGAKYVQGVRMVPQGLLLLELWLLFNREVESQIRTTRSSALWGASTVRLSSHMYLLPIV